MYKVTALQDVTLRIRLCESTASIWLTLKRGVSHAGVALVLGVHPLSLPDHLAIPVGGVNVVRPKDWTDDRLPQEFFGLYRIEREVGDPPNARLPESA